MLSPGVSGNGKPAPPRHETGGAGNKLNTYKLQGMIKFKIRAQRGTTSGRLLNAEDSLAPASYRITDRGCSLLRSARPSWQIP